MDPAGFPWHSFLHTNDEGNKTSSPQGLCVRGYAVFHEHIA